MKLIEKKCPNCGAGLSFDKDSHDVTCEYCKKSYVIERENTHSKSDVNQLEEYYKLVEEFSNRPVNKVGRYFIIAITVIIFGSTIFGIIQGLNNFNNVSSKANSSFINNIKKDVYVTEISQIDENSLEMFHKESLNELNVHSQTGYGESTEWSYVGMYLLNSKSNDDNILYDVFKRIVNFDGNVYEVYGTVEYEHLKLGEDNKVINDFSGYCYLPMNFIKGSYFILGYEGNESLYFKSIRSLSDKYSIQATEGLYIEN